MNIFLLTYTFNEFRFSKSLIEKYKLENNIVFYRKPFRAKASKEIIIKDFHFNRAYAVPLIPTNNYIVKKLNLVIYIFFISFYLLIKKKYNNLVIGNYLFEGQRSICNLFSKYFKMVFVIDEGTSTINLPIIRQEFFQNGFRKKWKERILKTYHIQRQLIFYTNFSLTVNSIDEIQLIDDCYLNSSDKKIDNNALYFLGTYLVEAGIISASYFDCILLEVIKNNPDLTIIYIPHPREKLIYINPLIKNNRVIIKKLNSHWEQYLFETNFIPKVVASHVSSAFHYTKFILGNKIEYQNYVINSAELIKSEHIIKFKNIYSAFDVHTEQLNYTKFLVSSNKYDYLT